MRKFVQLVIAGKNNIAIESMRYVKSFIPHEQLMAIPNDTDNGQNDFQMSYRKFCMENGIRIISIDDCYYIENLVFISLEFNKIINPFRFKTSQLFNIHFSKLPEYKGMYTSALPILHGRTESGVTLHLIDNGIDTGDIIDQIVFPIETEESCRDLYLKYIYNGMELFKRNILNLLDNRYIAIKQPISGSTYFSKKAIDYKNLRIDLNKTAFEIKNQIRAFTFEEYQLPELFGYKIEKAEILVTRSSQKPGRVLFENSSYIIVSTIDFDIKLIKFQH